MSDGTRRIKLADGRVMSGPADKFGDMEARLKARGIAFEEIPAGPVRDEPGRDGMSRDGQDDGGGVLETLGDGARGAMHGATWGVGDAIAEHFGAEPYSKVAERSPIASTVGDVAGSVFSPVGNKVGGLVKGAGKLAMAGRAALQGAAEGGIREFSDSGDIGDAALAAGGGGVLGGGVAGALGGGVSKVGEFLGNQADKARARSVGLLSKEAKALADKFGIAQLPKEIAAIVERVSPSGWTGKSAATRATELEGALDSTYGPAIDNVLKQASSQGLDSMLPGSWQALAQQLSGKASAAASSPAAITDEGAAFANALQRQADKLGQSAAPADLVGMRQANTAWRKAAYGKGLSIPDSASKQAAGELGNLGEATIDDIMSQANPATNQAFHAANKDYEERALIQNMAAKRAEVEATDTMLPALAAGAVAHAVLGPWGAALALITGTKNQAIQQLGKSRGVDALANVARAAERGVHGVARRIEGAAESKAVRNLPADIASGLVDSDGDSKEPDNDEDD